MRNTIICTSLECQICMFFEILKCVCNLVKIFLAGAVYLILLNMFFFSFLLCQFINNLTTKYTQQNNTKLEPIMARSLNHRVKRLGRFIVYFYIIIISCLSVCIENVPGNFHFRDVELLKLSLNPGVKRLSLTHITLLTVLTRILSFHVCRTLSARLLSFFC